ncbi:MAG: tetratricopeptide repeat protein [Chitinophagales bacterium]
MAKKTNNKPAPVNKQKQAPVVESIPVTPVIKDSLIPAWLYEFKIQAIIVAILAFGFYINSFNNEFAHDDSIVIIKNEYVLEGFAGIHDILTKDAYDSYYKQFNSTNQLSGGRYRPLSIVTFAIEQQFFGATPKSKIDSVIANEMSFGVRGPKGNKVFQQMHIRHLFNVLWFTLSVVVVLYFLRYIVFKSNPIIALIAAIIFTIHPIHTEVVANVKSRDEIMSILFMCLTFIFAFKYQEQKHKWLLGAGLLSFFFAFLSKEYAITMIVLLPLAFYLFNRFTIQKSIMATLPYLLVVGLYLYIRSTIVGPQAENSNDEILNNPYLLASSTEKLATEIATTLNYLKLLIYPYPLSADYSYNQIPYKDFSHPLVWLSLIVHGGLIAAMFMFFKKVAQQRGNLEIANVKFASVVPLTGARVLCFAIAFYLLHLVLVCNIVFDIGATMGERLIYHSSLGFSIALAWFLYKGMEKIKPTLTGRLALAGFMVIIITWSGFKTVARNADWKNDFTLFSHDLDVVPNSVLVNGNVAAALIDMADFEKDPKKKNEDLVKGVQLLNKATSLHPTYVAAYLNKGIAYFKLGQPDSAKMNFDKVSVLYPNHPKLAESYYNLGVAFYLNKQYPQAFASWQATLRLSPNYAMARNAINILNQELAKAQQNQQQTQQQPPQQQKQGK